MSAAPLFGMQGSGEPGNRLSVTVNRMNGLVLVSAAVFSLPHHPFQLLTVYFLSSS